MPDIQKDSGRRNLTLVIRAFVNEDGMHYGVVSDPGETEGWQATFSRYEELFDLILGRLDKTSKAVRGADPDAPGPQVPFDPK